MPLALITTPLIHGRERKPGHTANVQGVLCDKAGMIDHLKRDRAQKRETMNTAEISVGQRKNMEVHCEAVTRLISKLEAIPEEAFVEKHGGEQRVFNMERALNAETQAVEDERRREQEELEGAVLEA